MTPKKFIALALLLAAIVGAILWTLRPRKAESMVLQSVPAIIYVDRPTLSSKQVIWLAHLMNCESGIDSKAINPKDLDNTPSWGILQFKPATFVSFAAKLGIKSELMDPEAQVSIVTDWILHPGAVRWEQQFPACVHKWGLPPTQ